MHLKAKQILRLPFQVLTYFFRKLSPGNITAEVAAFDFPDRKVDFSFLFRPVRAHPAVRPVQYVWVIRGYLGMFFRENDPESFEIFVGKEVEAREDISQLLRPLPKGKRGSGKESPVEVNDEEHGLASGHFSQ